ncbi:MAG: DUF3626 domain-containing protein [Peptoniphilus harei]|nr:DUF3626 domain-containing protein [Peptoniphilus harei]
MQIEFERCIKSREKELANNFNDTYKDIKKELLKIYNKCEVDNKIDLDELRKYDRIKKFDDIILSSIATNSLLNKKAINKLLNDVVDKTEKDSFGVINSRVTIKPVKRTFDTKALVHKEVAGKAWEERLKHHTANFMYDVHGIVRQGLEQGDSYTTMAKAVKKKFGKEVNKELFLVRTEARRIQEFTKFETMKEVDKQIELVKVWRTMQDEAVRSTHQAMEGVEVGMNDEFVLPSGATCLTPAGTGVPEEDCRCRCYVEYKIADKNQDLGYNNSDEDVDFSATEEVLEKEDREEKVEKVRPKTLSNFEEHAQKWTDDVVKKHLNDDQREVVGNYLKDLIDTNEYSMRVDSNNLGKVIDSGRFKTLFETETSNGSLNLDWRKKATKQLFGTGKKRIKAEEREKYGYLGAKDFIADRHSVDASQYGNCIVRFDKSYLKDRVTYTTNDSLGYAIHERTIAGNADNPSANGISDNLLTKTYNVIANNPKLNLEEFLDETGSRYIELQYHGELKTDYIKEICFIDESPDDLLIDKLKKKNIKVFKMMGDYDNEKVIEI